MGVVREMPRSAEACTRAGIRFVPQEGRRSNTSSARGRADAEVVLDGVDLTWASVPGAEKLRDAAARVRSHLRWSIVPSIQHC